MRTFFVCTILVFCCLAIGCSGVAFQPNSDAMAPTITTKDMAVANSFAYSSKPIERFDIVVFELPEDSKKLHNIQGELKQIKRVIVLSNEKIEIKNNQIYINDKLLDEPFEKTINEKDIKKNFPSFVIPNDEYFLIGDNRYNSEDSRHWKKVTVNKKDIYSKIVEIKKDYYK